MDLFDPDADDSREFPELSKSAKPAQEGQSRLPVIGAVIGAIVLVVLLVLLGRFIYHKVNNSSAKNVSGSSQVSPQTASSGSQSGSSSSPSPSSSSSANSSSNSNSNTAKTPATVANGSLPNNGPGNTIAIFAGTSLAAAGLHYIISLRRSNRSSI